MIARFNASHVDQLVARITQQKARRCLIKKGSWLNGVPARHVARRYVARRYIVRRYVARRYDARRYVARRHVARKQKRFEGGPTSSTVSLEQGLPDPCSSETSRNRLSSDASVDACPLQPWTVSGFLRVIGFSFAGLIALARAHDGLLCNPRNDRVLSRSSITRRSRRRGVD